MTFVLKFCLTVLSCMLAFVGTASATSVGASGSASVFWNLDYAMDVDGNSVDGSGAVTFSGRSSISTSSAVNTENGVSSSSDSSIFSITNISSDIFVYWSASIEALSFASAYSDSTALGDYYFDSNSSASVGGTSVFASTNGGLACRDNNPNSANFDCFGYAQGRGDNGFDYVFAMLAPGETFRFELAVQSFATTRFTPVSAVPLPATGLLLGFALIGLGMVRRVSSIA